MSTRGVLKLTIPGSEKYLITRTILTERTHQRIKGPLYHVTSCFDNSINITNHNWISLVHFDPDCTGVIHTGALADIITPNIQSDTLAVIVNIESFQYINSFENLDVEIYDDNLRFMEGLDYIKFLFFGFVLFCITLKIIEMFKKCFKNLKIKSKKYISDDELHCTICIEDVLKNEYYKELPCNHKFHTKCIDEWLERKEICPNCNAPSDEQVSLLNN